MKFQLNFSLLISSNFVYFLPKKGKLSEDGLGFEQNKEFFMNFLFFFLTFSYFDKIMIFHFLLTFFWTNKFPQNRKLLCNFSSRNTIYTRLCLTKIDFELNILLFYTNQNIQHKLNLVENS